MQTAGPVALCLHPFLLSALGQPTERSVARSPSAFVGGPTFGHCSYDAFVQASSTKTLFFLFSRLAQRLSSEDGSRETRARGTERREEPASLSAHSSARTPAVTSKRVEALIAPMPNIVVTHPPCDRSSRRRRASRARDERPAHIGQGSRVTYTVAPRAASLQLAKPRANCKAFPRAAVGSASDLARVAPRADFFAVGVDDYASDGHLPGRRSEVRLREPLPA